MEFDVVSFAVLFRGEVSVCHHCHWYRTFNNFTVSFTGIRIFTLRNSTHCIGPVIGKDLPVIPVGVILHQFQESITHFVFAMADQ